jgi:hypothetical protein
MATFQQDTFTGTAGVAITDRSPEVGTWEGHPAKEGMNLVLSDANRARGNGTASDTGTLYFGTGLPDGPNYSVTAVIVAKSLHNLAGVMGRMDTTDYTGYEAIYNAYSGATQWRLAKRIAGAFTLLGTFSQSLTLDQDYTLKLEMIGTAIKVYVDGVERISVTDSDISAAGRVGLYAWGNDVTPSNTAAIHLSSVQGDDVSGRKWLLRR